jgi:hypothetical protein
MRPLYANTISNQQSAKSIARLEKERNAKTLSKKRQNSIQTTFVQKKISEIKTIASNETTIN